MNVPGRHHVTAIASDTRASVEFSIDGGLPRFGPFHRGGSFDDTATDGRMHRESALSEPGLDGPIAEVD